MPTVAREFARAGGRVGVYDEFPSFGVVRCVRDSSKPTLDSVSRNRSAHPLRDCEAVSRVDFGTSRVKRSNS